MKNTWTVFVGGIEVNDYLLTESQAKALAREYQQDGYDDAQAVEVNHA